MSKIYLTSVFKTLNTVAIEATAQEIIDYNTSGEWPARWRERHDAADHRAITNAKAHGIDLEFDDCWVDLMGG